MKLFERVAKLASANINHLLDQAEDPEVMIKQIIRDMEESIVELRRETVSAVAKEKQLKRQIKLEENRAADLEAKATLALDEGEEEMARSVLAKKLEALRSRDTLIDDLGAASKLAAQLTSDLLRMEDQAGIARRKKDELIRRKRAADARLRTQEAVRRSAAAVRAASGRLTAAQSTGAAFDTYANAISALEAEAEAARELAPKPDDTELKLQKLAERSELDEELERLRRQRAAD